MGAPKVKQPTRQDYSKLYDELRTVPFSNWQKVKPEDLAKAVKTDVEEAQALMVAAKIAYQTEKGQFIEYMMMGDVPPIKLDKDEMELLKGGKNKTLGWALIGGGLGLIGTAVAAALGNRNTTSSAPVLPPAGFESDGVSFRRGDSGTRS